VSADDVADILAGLAARPSTPRAWGALVAAAAALTGASVAGAAPAGKAMAVRPDTLVHLKGSDMYCTVLKQGTTIGVACFHDPGGPSSNVRKGYAAVATEEGVAVEPSGSNTPSAGYKQPSLKKFGVISGGSAHAEPIDVGDNAVIGVSGTHMAVFTTPAVGGGTAIGVVYVNPGYRTIIGAYSVGISNHYISMVEVTGVDKTRVVYRHAVY
jgi:hypothetical protein